MNLVMTQMHDNHAITDNRSMGRIDIPWSTSGGHVCSNVKGRWSANTEFTDCATVDS